MKFVTKVVCDNAAFENNVGVELARILREMADAVENGAQSGSIRDINGNYVANFYLVDEE